MLIIDNLTVAYGDTIALDSFSLTLKKGEVVSIVGESGSGKSTAIKAILGALSSEGRVLSGDIIYNGSSLLNMTKRGFKDIRGTDISMIFQDCAGSLNPIRKIGSQYVEYIREHTLISKKDAIRRAQEMLEKMKLADVDKIMNCYPHQLSGGMRQRVGIAFALTFEPEILIADEPTSALDVTTQAQIVRQMIELRDEYDTGIIIVTHNIGVASYMGDKIIVMHNGKIVDRGSRDEVINNPTSRYTQELLAAVPKMEGERYV